MSELFHKNFTHLSPHLFSSHSIVHKASLSDVYKMIGNI